MTCGKRPLPWMGCVQGLGEWAKRGSWVSVRAVIAALVRNG